jgi:predicted phage terminase large subunit-like protein
VSSLIDQIKAGARQNPLDQLSPEELESTRAYLEAAVSRQRAGEDLESYVKYTKPDWDSAAHHQEIFGVLGAFERGEIPRLIIEAPPRHGKTESASRRLPSYLMGKYPGTQVVCSTYNQDFANDIGRDVRHIVKQPEYTDVFDATLRQDSKAADRFHLDNGSMYVAVGRGSGLTGRGMHYGIVDDPLKDRKEAESQRTRDELWDWFRAVFYTRQMPNCNILIMNTRWHTDDLTGRVLEQEGDKWHRLTLPAIADEGQPHESALWPEWYPLETLYDIRATIGPRDWLALYQQSPTSEEGTLFKADWYRVRYTSRPANLNIYMSGDFGTIAGGGDFTELAVWGVDEGGQVYVLDWWHGQASTDVWIDQLLTMAEIYEPLEFIGEMGLIRRSVEPLLNTEMRRRNIYVSCVWLPHNTGNKTAMGRPFQGMSAMGNVHFPNAPWADRVIDQLVKFPDDKYDDAADACFLFGRHVANIVSARKPRVKDESKIICAENPGHVYPVSYFKKRKSKRLYM